MVAIERLDLGVGRFAHDRRILLQKIVFLRDAPVHDLVVAIEPECDAFAIQNLLTHIAVDQELQLLVRRRATVLLLVGGSQPLFHRRIDDDAVAVASAAGAPLSQQQDHQADCEKVRERLARDSHERISRTPPESRQRNRSFTHRSVPRQSKFTRNVAPYERGAPGNWE